MANCVIEHAGITVTDLERAVRWYGGYFGAEEERRFEKVDFEIKAATLRMGDSRLEIFQPFHPLPAPCPGKWPAEFFRPLGVHHLAIAVADVGALFERMKADRVEVLTDLVEGRFFFCRDPFGTRLEVRQRK